MNVYSQLRPSDEIRVIAPSMAWQKRQERRYDRARHLLETAGYRVTFGRRIAASERFGTASMADRLADLHEGYADKDVKAIMALHGGWSANALLPGIDWDLVRANPKPLIGFSDITVLLNAIHAKTGHINYLGPNFSSLGARRCLDYTWQQFRDVLTETEPLPLTKSREWDRQRREPLRRTPPWKVLQPGTAEGRLLGGNIGTFYLLQGTGCFPAFTAPTILAIEDDDEAGSLTAREFDRRLESLLQVPGVRQAICGVLVGRFQPASRVTVPDIAYIVRRLNLPDVPIIANVDFGHTRPLLTLPVGGTVSMAAAGQQATINLLRY
jgi:muramoyltetrapeptide carboxypeptidase LdcA involved in peptidoglycan recycling